MKGLLLIFTLLLFIPSVVADHTFDTSGNYLTTTTAWSTVDPGNLSYTAGTGSTVMVLGIYVVGSTYRTDGTPTFNGKSFISLGRNVASTPETTAELWYLPLSTTDTGAAYNISVPNAATSRDINFAVVTFKSGTGMSGLDSNNSTNGMTANPNNSVTTTVTGDAIVSVLGSGAGTSTGAIGYGGTQLYVNDPGAYFGKFGYKIMSGTGTNYSGWTVAADDFALLTAAFKETVKPEPPSPINLANTTGTTWVNHTWSVGSGNITDSYNISQNETWTNGSALTYFNASIVANGWSNISVYAYNTSGAGSLNATPISQNTQVNESEVISGRNLAAINHSVNNGTNCAVDWISYTNLNTQVEYTYRCGQIGNWSITPNYGEAIWMNLTIASMDKVRDWS